VTFSMRLTELADCWRRLVADGVVNSETAGESPRTTMEGAPLELRVDRLPLLLLDMVRLWQSIYSDIHEMTSIKLYCHCCEISNWHVEILPDSRRNPGVLPWH